MEIKAKSILESYKKLKGIKEENEEVNPPKAGEENEPEEDDIFGEEYEMEDEEEDLSLDVEDDEEGDGLTEEEDKEIEAEMEKEEEESKETLESLKTTFKEAKVLVESFKKIEEKANPERSKKKSQLKAKVDKARELVDTLWSKMQDYKKKARARIKGIKGQKRSKKDLAELKAKQKAEMQKKVDSMANGVDRAETVLNKLIDQYRKI